MQNDVLTVAEKRAEAQSGKPRNAFDGGVRPIDGSSVQPGDQLCIPEDFKVYTVKFGNRSAQYTIAYGIDSDKKPVARNIFPSLYQARVYEYDTDETGKPVPTGTSVPNKGAAVDAYQACGLVNDGIKAIAGKWQLFETYTSVKTKRFGSDEMYEAPRFDISFVEKPAELAEETTEESAKKPSKGAK